MDEYLADELEKFRIAGPFKKTAIPEAHINRFGVIPKKHYHNWRLIFDLPHPMGFSINDEIPKYLCSLQYITVDTAIRHIITLGQGTLLAKLDVKSAFQLMPVHPTDRHLVTSYVLE